MSIENYGYFLAVPRESVGLMFEDCAGSYMDYEYLAILAV